MDNIITNNAVTAEIAEDIIAELAAAGVDCSMSYNDRHLESASNGDCSFIEFALPAATDEKLAALEAALAKRGIDIKLGTLEVVDTKDDARAEEITKNGVDEPIIHAHEADKYVNIPIEGIMDPFAVEEIDENTPEEILDALVDNADYTEYGLPVVEVGGGTYLIAKDEDAAKDAAREYIENTIWAFSPDFLSVETGIDSFVFVTLAVECEAAQEGVLDIVEATCGLDSFVEAAIAADGIGHFLAFYDGQELEVGGHRVYRRD